MYQCCAGNVVSVHVCVLVSQSSFSHPYTSANFGEYFDANKLQHAGVVAWTCIIYEVNHAWIFPGIIILSLY